MPWQPVYLDSWLLVLDSFFKLMPVMSISAVSMAM
jgi:hypothetical protein